jgi:hypothetical protein
MFIFKLKRVFDKLDIVFGILTFGPLIFMGFYVYATGPLESSLILKRIVESSPVLLPVSASALVWARYRDGVKNHLMYVHEYATIPIYQVLYLGITEPPRPHSLEFFYDPLRSYIERFELSIWHINNLIHVKTEVTRELERRYSEGLHWRVIQEGYKVFSYYKEVLPAKTSKLLANLIDRLKSYDECLAHFAVTAYDKARQLGVSDDRLTRMMNRVFYRLGWTEVKPSCGELEDAAITIASELKERAEQVEQTREGVLLLLDELKGRLEEYMIRSGVEVPTVPFEWHI